MKCNFVAEVEPLKLYFQNKIDRITDLSIRFSDFRRHNQTQITTAGDLAACAFDGEIARIFCPTRTKVASGIQELSSLRVVGFLGRFLFI